jgi:hypothetical protein
MSEFFHSIREVAGEWWNSLVEKTRLRTVSYPLLHHPDDASVCTLDLPWYRQAQTYTCGFVAGLMVLHYFRPRRSIDRFLRLTYPTPENGALSLSL